jgi:proline racemase
VIRIGICIVARSARPRKVPPTTYPAIISEFPGLAFITAHHQFVLDPQDPCGTVSKLA